MPRLWSKLLPGVVIGILVFAGFSIYADTDKLGASLARFSWGSFAIAIGLALLNYALRFFRWTLYLRHRCVDIPNRSSLLVFLSGFALSVTPGKIGELIKSVLLKQIHGVAITKTAPIVVAERVTDLAALLVVGGVGVAIYGIAQTTVLAGVGLVVVGLLVLSWPRAAEALIRAATATRWTRRFRQPLATFYAELKSLVAPGPLAWGTGLAMIAWVAEGIGFAVIIAGFGEVGVPVILAVAIYSATTIAGALSFLPGGLLVTEAGMTLLLAQQGVSEAGAVAATILTRLATLWFAVVLGLAALVALRRVPGADLDGLADADEPSAKTAHEP